MGVDRVNDVRFIMSNGDEVNMQGIAESEANRFREGLPGRWIALNKPDGTAEIINTEHIVRITVT
jgi:hypothetical protein